MSKIISLDGYRNSKEPVWGKSILDNEEYIKYQIERNTFFENVVDKLILALSQGAT